MIHIRTTAGRRFAQASRAALLAGACLAGFAAAPARAQTGGGQAAAPAPDAQVAEVVVTAERRSQNIQNVPASVSAISGAALETRGVVNIDDVSRLVPSVNFGDFGYGSQISARGVGMNLIGGEGESSVAVQLDGVPLSRPSMANLAQDDLQRVEFLLGPQGTLYGRNATAGVLNLITNDPSPTFDASVTAGGGNYDAWNVKGYVSGPVGDGVRVRLYAGHQDRGGFLKDTLTGQDLENVDSTTVRAAVDADLSPTLALQVRAFDVRSLTAAPAYKPLAPVPGLSPADYDLDPWRIVADGRYASVQELRGVSAKLTDKIAGSEAVSLLTSYLHDDFKVNFDGDGVGQAIFQNVRPQYTEQYTGELLYQHDGARLKTTLGAFAMHEHIRDPNIIETPGFIPVEGLSALSFDTRKTNINGSLFGDATYALTDRFKLYGGLRGIVDHHEQELTDSLVFGPAAVPLCTPADSGGDESKTTEALTGRFGGQYTLSDDSNLYGTVSRGYKSGGFNGAACANSYSPEILNAVELGSKNRFFDRRVVLNLSAYYYDFKDLQVEQVVGAASIIDNVPKSEVYGVDVSGEWRVNSRLSIDGNASLLHARYVNFFYIDQLTNINLDLAGKPLNRSPTASGNLGVQYRQPLPAGSLLLRTDLYATTRFALRPSNQPGDFQSSYTTLAASLTYVSPGGDLKVKAWVKNLTDEAYLEGLFAIPLFGLGREGIYAAPRTFGVELTKSFR